jgi:putative transcriptional regulator
MPIIVKVDEMLHERRMTLTELSERIGITLTNLSILKTGKARAVRFSTLEAICEALQCQPGDLLEFRPTQEKEAISDSGDLTMNTVASAITTSPLPRPGKENIK